MAVQQWTLHESKKRKRRQTRVRTNVAGRLKQQRVRKLRVQHMLKESSSLSSSSSSAAAVAAAIAAHKGALPDRPDMLKREPSALLPKNFNNSSNEVNMSGEDMGVSNADYFDAIMHAVIPGPLDIPSLYRASAPHSNASNIHTSFLQPALI